jgi:hypothetical protein
MRYLTAISQGYTAWNGNIIVNGVGNIAHTGVFFNEDPVLRILMTCTKDNFGVNILNIWF